MKDPHDSVTADAFDLSKEPDGTGCVMVMASGIGCVAVCIDHTHADYVIKALQDGRYRIGAKGIEVVKEQS